MGRPIVIKLIFFSLCVAHQEALPTEGVSPESSPTIWISSLGSFSTEETFTESGTGNSNGDRESENSDIDGGDSETVIHGNGTINDGGRDDGDGEANDENDDSDEDENIAELDDSDDDDADDDDDDDDNRAEDDYENDDDDYDTETEEDEESDDYEYLYTDSYDLNHTYYDAYSYDDKYDDYDGFFEYDYYDNYSDYTYDYDNTTTEVASNISLSTMAEENEVRLGDDGKVYMFLSANSMQHIDIRDILMENNTNFPVDTSEKNDTMIKADNESLNKGEKADNESLNNNINNIDSNDTKNTSGTYAKLTPFPISQNETSVSLHMDDKDDDDNGFLSLVLMSTESENATENGTSVKGMASDFVPRLSNDTHVYVGWTSVTVLKSNINDWQGISVDGNAEHDDRESDTVENDTQKNNHSVQSNENDNNLNNETIINKTEEVNTTLNETVYQQSNTSGNNTENDEGKLTSERNGEGATEPAAGPIDLIQVLGNLTDVQEKPTHLVEGDGKNMTDIEREINEIFIMILKDLESNYKEYKPNDPISSSPNSISTADREEKASGNVFIRIDTANGTKDPNVYLHVKSDSSLPVFNNDKFNGILYYEVDDDDDNNNITSTSDDDKDDDDNITSTSGKIVSMTKDELTKFLEKHKENIETKDEFYDNTMTWNETKAVNNVTTDVNDNRTLETNTNTDEERKNKTAEDNGEIDHENDAVRGNATESDFGGENEPESKENTITTGDISDHETTLEYYDESGSTDEDNSGSEITNETWVSEYDGRVHYDANETEENQTTEVDYTTSSIYVTGFEEGATTEGDLPNNGETEMHMSDIFSIIYEQLIKSNELTSEEKRQLGNLERIRRSVEALGGLRALRRDPKAHHIVKRQVQTMEACGGFSKRRRRDISTRNYDPMAAAFAANKPSGDSFATELRRKHQWPMEDDEYQLQLNPSESSTSSATRHKRGINNVGKRLENGNPGFKQLYNQYKNMCSFVAMVAFEK